MVNTQNRNDTKFKIFFCTLRCVKNLLWFLVCLLSIEGLFVENLLSWILQALFVFLLLPFLSNLKGIPFAELPAYLNRGAACFLNIGGNLKDCHGAPLLPLLYMALNIAFNISMLNLVKMSTAVVASLTSTLAVPLTIYVLSLPLPYLPEGTNLSASFIIGAVTLVLGLLLYNLPQRSADQMKKD